MKVRVFGISDRSTLDALPETELSSSWQEDELHRWIDVEAATTEELDRLLAPLGLNPAIREACLRAERSARFVSHRSALYMEVPTHLGWDQTEKPYVSVLCLLSVQRRVDNRLRFLTILSAVFLPLTLISAVYGMNFDDLPGMGVPYGYLVVIALMVATAGLTGAYLYWRGWFE